MFEPKEVSDLDIIFPGNVNHLIPPEKEWIKANSHDFKLGRKLFNDIFFSGLDDIKLVPKEGVDSDKAWRHIRVLIGTFSTKHEDKETMVAYLMQLWFDLEKSTWEKGTQKR